MENNKKYKNKEGGIFEKNAWLKNLSALVRKNKKLKNCASKI
jgi:hypothetical protein